MGGQITQSQALGECFNLIVSSGVCPETPIRDWVKIILFLHKKGWLWIGLEDNHVSVVAAAYRVLDLKEKTLDYFPEKEGGDILYVPWMASRAKDKLLPKKILTRYMEKHPEVKEIHFIEWNDGNEKPRTFKRTKEAESGKQGKESITTSNTNISGRSTVQART